MVFVRHSMEEHADKDEEVVNYKKEYRNLKRKIRYLIYENETFQESLRKTRHSLLKVSRDNSFLMDQLLQYEKVPVTSSESDETESSDDGGNIKSDSKRKKLDPNTHGHGSNTSTSGGVSKNQNSVKKKRPPPKTTKLNTAGISQANLPHRSDGLMTPEEIERHLTAHQPFLQLMPEKAPLTVPTDFFSNDPSLDRKFLSFGQKIISSTF